MKIRRFHKPLRLSFFKRRIRSDDGSALLFAIICIGMMLAISGAMTMMLVADAQAVVESSKNQTCLYLAENGLSTAKWEIASSQDPQGDGPGNANQSTSSGSFSVTAVDLGAGRYELTSTGSVGSTSVTLVEVILQALITRFPPAALSMVGPSREMRLEFSSSTNLQLDGDDSPAVAVTDQEKYNDVSSQINSALSKGILQATDLTGALLNSSQPGNSPAVQYLPDPDSTYKICDGFYSDFRTQMMSSFLPQTRSTRLPSSRPKTITHGSSASPVKLQFPKDQRLRRGQTLTGYGTLVFSKNLVVESGATLDWKGNVIVFGDPSSDASLQIGGRLQVDGTLLVMAATGRDAKFLGDSRSEVTVNGAFLMVTDYTQPNHKAAFEVRNNFTVNGVLMELSPNHETQFRSGSVARITGSYELGPALDPLLDLKTRLKFESDMTISRDSPAMQAGGSAIANIAQALGKPALTDYLTRKSMTTLCWYKP
jgi:hypothetical protein